jgi:alkyldihydroxyacetonephosphate synthase
MSAKELDVSLSGLFEGLEHSTKAEVLDAYSHDSWPLQTKLAMTGAHEFRPDIVVFAKSTQDVVRVLKSAQTFSIPVTTRGLGSSVTGQPLPQRGGIVLDVSGITGPAEVSAVDLTVTVGAGWRGGDLENLLREQGLTLGNSPQSLHRSTIGGWVATRESGQLSSRYGGIEDLVLGLEVVLADGSVSTIGSIPRAAMGPELVGVFIGSEGTLGIITRVSLRVSKVPEHSLKDAFHFSNLESALGFIQELAQSDTRPALVRLYDEEEAQHVLKKPDYKGFLALIETQGPKVIASATHDWYRQLAVSNKGTLIGPEPVETWMARRYDFSAVENLLASTGGYAETIEVAHSWTSIGNLYKSLKAGLAGYADHVYGHFSHVYPQGTSLYMILLGKKTSDDEAVRALQDIWRVAMKISVEQGAVLSHHHGAGLARLPYIQDALGSGHNLLTRVKNGLDPEGILNPGKLGL